MRRLLVAVIAAAVPTLPVHADSPGTPGFMTPNGVFRPASNASPAAAAATPTEYQGLIQGSFVIAFKTTPAPTSVRCTLNVEIINFNGTYTDTVEDAGVDLATVSGGKANCVPKVPYTWYLYLGSQDQVNLTFTITASDAKGIVRSSTQSLQTIPVPANHQTTTVRRGLTL